MERSSRSITFAHGLPKDLDLGPIRKVLTRQPLPMSSLP